jgi:hypothetical protein
LNEPVPDHVEAKIADEELRRLARTGNGSATVLVELELPEARVRLEGGPSAEGRAWRPVGVEEPSEDEQRAIETVGRQARALLEDLADAPPVELAGGGSYAVRVSGAALDELARSPLVRRIHRSELRR